MTKSRTCSGSVTSAACAWTAPSSSPAASTSASFREQIATRALELDSTLGVPHATLGWIRFVTDLDFSGPDQDFRRALELSPGSSWIRSWYADYLALAGRFDAAVNWFTSFGYFDDEGNRSWLETVFETLKAGGRLAIDVHSRDVFMRNRMPASVYEREGNLVVDSHSFDVETGREATERWLVRDGQVRKTGYSVRFYTYTELRDLLLGVGFSSVEGIGHDRKPLTLESRRMIVIATR